MTLQNSDFMRLRFKTGDVTVAIKKINEGHGVDFGWPPPEWIHLDTTGRIHAGPGEETHSLRRVSFSQLTDELADHPNLARGAVYEYRRPSEYERPD